MAVAGIGDNSNAPLKSFVERVEHLLEERATFDQDIKEVLDEAKAQGFDKKILRKVIKLRAMDADKRREEEALLATYCAALGLE